jgi:hypothetical protein
MTLDASGMQPTPQLTEETLALSSEPKKDNLFYTVMSVR